MRTCANCRHARKPVLKQHGNMVGCALATRFEEIEEKFIDMGAKKGDHHFYSQLRPTQKGKGVMRVGTMVSTEFVCIDWKE